MAVDPQAAQINLIRHQHTEILSGKHKKEKNLLLNQKIKSQACCSREFPSIELQ